MLSEYEILESKIKEHGTLFKNREVFTTSYLPEIYNFRNNQLKAMAVYYDGVEEGIVPQHMLLYGSFATGKTSTTQTFFKSAEKRYDNLICIHVNCRFNTAEYDVLSAIYKSLFKGAKIEVKLSSILLFEKIVDYIIKNDKILVVALDDYIYIKKNIELNNLLFKLLRANEVYPDAKISIIAITNYEGKMDLEQRVATVFRPVEINFPKYSYNEMYSILKQRCQLGLIEGVLSREVLELITNNTYDIGDLRNGISLLNQGAKNAELYGRVFITPECIFRILE